MGEPRSIAIYETVYGQYDHICWGKIDLENITGFQSLMREIECMVREVSGKDPLFEFDVTYVDLDDNSLNIMTTPWAFFRSRIDEIGITQKYDVPDGREIPIEGIDQIMKLDIGPIGNFFSFYRALQFLGSAYTNTDPEDHFTSEEPWEGYSLYLLSNQHIIITPHMVWRSAGQLWEGELVEFDTATVASSMDSNNEEDELMSVKAEIGDASSVVAGMDDASLTDDDASEMAGNIAGVDKGSSTDDDDSESAGNVLVSGIGFYSSEEEDEVDDFLQWETKHVTDWKEVQNMLIRIVFKPKLLSG
ncbi:hypothetical protein SO802_030958 [Lithocarpus litseifolius]|uniref:Uncharacterized protein n=1 Tax=Lithocarpus litseifolius TaxID=425828 RepID=A0AAW2BJS5_9ROSI